MKIEEFEQLKEESIGHSLIKAGRLFKDYSFEEFKRATGLDDLRPAHLDLMAYIEFEGSSVVDIAKRAGISKQAVSVLVKELLELKVLKKIPNPHDKRAIIVSFNLKSKNSIFKGMQFLASLDSEIIEVLGESRSKAFLKDLNKLVTYFG